MSWITFCKLASGVTFYSSFDEGGAICGTSIFSPLSAGIFEAKININGFKIESTKKPNIPVVTGARGMPLIKSPKYEGTMDVKAFPVNRLGYEYHASINIFDKK